LISYFIYKSFAFGPAGIDFILLKSSALKSFATNKECVKNLDGVMGETQNRIIEF
jgi:hypothetical protein